MVALLALGVLCLAECSPAAAPGPTAPSAALPRNTESPAPPASSGAAVTGTGDIIVFAAASLTNVFNDLGAAFTQTNPEAHISFSYASSGTLATQLSQGARADVFASADQNTMNTARSAGALTGPDRVFARNSLIIITPRDNRAHVSSLKDLAMVGVKLVTAANTVPIGQYTESMIEKASADPAYGSDFGARVEQNIVSRQTDDRQIVAAVQLGEADAAVVYATDVTPETRDALKSIAVTDALNTVVTYPIATAAGDNPRGGQAFASFVLSARGQSIVTSWGFLEPGP